MSGTLMATRMQFDAGALLLRSGGYRARIMWQPAPRAEEQDQHGRWKEFWPAIRLIGPERQDGSGAAPAPVADAGTGPEARCNDAQATESALSSFKASIPAGLAQFVEPFQSHQWPLLKLLHYVEEMMDWATENPVLAYCVANNGEFRAISNEAAAIEARHHCMRKQVEILEWLKFPCSQPVVRLLKKILPAAAEPSRLRRLRAAIRADGAVLESLSHHRQIGVGTMALFANRETCRLVTPRLLEEVAAKSDERCGAPTANMLSRALHVLSGLPNHVVQRPLCSIRAVRELHDEVMAAARDLAARQREMLELARNRPPVPQPGPARRRGKPAAVSLQVFLPPIPGTEHIIPLATKAALDEEGRTMRNCIATYAPYIRKGTKYAYSLLYPERATLLIAKGSLGLWRREDLRLKANRLPSGVLVRMVDAWLERCSPHPQTPTLHWKNTA